MQDKELADKLSTAAKEIREELMPKAEELELQAQSNEELVITRKPVAALRHATNQAIRMLELLLLQADEGTLIKPSQFENAIDLSLGDILPFTMDQFEAFTRGENLTHPTFVIAFEFRKAMLEKLEKIFAEISETAN